MIQRLLPSGLFNRAWLSNTLWIANPLWSWSTPYVILWEHISKSQIQLYVFFYDGQHTHVQYMHALKLANIQIKTLPSYLSFIKFSFYHWKNKTFGVCSVVWGGPHCSAPSRAVNHHNPSPPTSHKHKHNDPVFIILH